MTDPRPGTHAEIEARATAYVLAREEPGWSQVDQAELDAWLAQSVAHKVAYIRLEHAWRRADRIAALGAPAETPRRAREANRWRGRMFASRRAWRPWAAAAAAAAVSVALTTLVSVGAFAQHSYVTDVGGRATAPLADGSRLELNTDTRLRARVGGGVRTVWLDHGEAYFEVKHDSAHPFVVYAGDRRITVLGTKFLVRRDGDEVRVAVVEGRVRVDVLGAPEGTLEKAAAHAVMIRGDVIDAKGASTLVEPRSVEKVDAALSWRQGMLTFDQTSLSEAAAEFNRYNQVKLVIDDPAAAGVRIGGVFKAEEADAFAHLLQEAYGLKVERRGDEIRISS